MGREQEMLESRLNGTDDLYEEQARRPGTFRFVDTDESLFDETIDWTPERQLMLAILQDAVACYQQTLKRPRQNPEILARQAEFWIRLDDWNSPFSFNCICEELSLNPEATRELILGGQLTPHKPTDTRDASDARDTTDKREEECAA